MHSCVNSCVHACTHICLHTSMHACTQILIHRSAKCLLNKTINSSVEGRHMKRGFQGTPLVKYAAKVLMNNMRYNWLT